MPYLGALEVCSLRDAMQTTFTLRYLSLLPSLIFYILHHYWCPWVLAKSSVLASDGHL